MEIMEIMEIRTARRFLRDTHIGKNRRNGHVTNNPHPPLTLFSDMLLRSHLAGPQNPKVFTE